MLVARMSLFWNTSKLRAAIIFSEPECAKGRSETCPTSFGAVVASNLSPPHCVHHIVCMCVIN